MPTYTVICAEKESGATHPLLVAAPTAIDASVLASTTGLIVGKVLLAIDDVEAAERSAATLKLAEASAHANADTARQLTAIKGSAIVTSPIGTIALGIVAGMILWIFLCIALMIALSVLGFTFGGIAAR